MRTSERLLPLGCTLPLFPPRSPPPIVRRCVALIGIAGSSKTLLMDAFCSGGGGAGSSSRTCGGVGRQRLRERWGGGIA